ncbi:MAG: hypothetical protein ACFBSC_13855 [Microcoleaceae cyanobacterium]
MKNNLLSRDVEDLVTGKGGTGVVDFVEIDNLQVDSIGFLDMENQDFRLTPNSPAVDAGTDEVLDEVLYPVSGDAIDVGAIELGSENPLSLEKSQILPNDLSNRPLQEDEDFEKFRTTREGFNF